MTPAKRMLSHSALGRPIGWKKRHCSHSITLCSFFLDLGNQPLGHHHKHIFKVGFLGSEIVDLHLFFDQLL